MQTGEKLHTAQLAKGTFINYEIAPQKGRYRVGQGRQGGQEWPKSKGRH